MAPQPSIHCTDCGLPIDDLETPVHSDSGRMHYRCYKRGTAHGEEITLLSLLEKIDMLQKRVYLLEEQAVENYKHRSNSFAHNVRVGGAD